MRVCEAVMTELAKDSRLCVYVKNRQISMEKSKSIC